MPLQRLGTAFSFFPDTPPETGANGGVTRTPTSLTQLSNGTVALGYTGILPGVVEIFNPTTGAEARDNLVLSSLTSAFGSTFYQDTPDVDVASVGNGFVAVWVEAEGSIFSPQNVLHIQTFNASGNAVSTLIEVNLGDNQYPANPEVFSTSSGFVVSYQSDREENTVQFYDSDGNPIGSPIITTGDQIPEMITLSNGNIAMILETEGTPGSISTPPGPDIVEIAIYNPANGNTVVEPFEISVSRDGLTLSDSDLAGIAALEGGGFAALVRTNYGGSVFFDVETYNNNGTTQSSIFTPRQIDFDVPTSALGQVDIVALPGGGYAIIYERTDDGAANQNLPDLDVYVQIYDANEALVGGPLRVNADQAGSQGGFDAIVTADGELLVSYYDLATARTLVQRIELPGSGSTGPTGGNDTLTGTAEGDSINGQGGNDSIEGLGGNDTLLGGNGKDTIKGGSGSDTLSGGGGNDRLFGGNQSDHLNGQGGKDRLNGDGGSDTLNGGGGADTLNGGKGNDTLIGGAGADTFVFNGKFGNDVINDFNALSNAEKIDLSAIGAITGMKDLRNNHLTQDGDDAVITVGNKTITLLNVDINDLGSGDFIF